MGVYKLIRDYLPRKIVLKLTLFNIPFEPLLYNYSFCNECMSTTTDA